MPSVSTQASGPLRPIDIPFGVRTVLLADRRVQLHLSGELDLAGAPELRDAVLACDPPGGTVEIDLADVSFLDTAGLHALCDAHAALVARGYRACLTGPRGRTLDLLDLAAVFGWLPTELECPDRPRWSEQRVAAPAP